MKTQKAPFAFVGVSVNFLLVEAQGWHSQLISLHLGRKCHTDVWWLFTSSPWWTLLLAFQWNGDVSFHLRGLVCRWHEITYSGQSNVGGLSVPFFLVSMIQNHMHGTNKSSQLSSILSHLCLLSQCDALPSRPHFLCSLPSSLLALHHTNSSCYWMFFGDICWYLLFFDSSP